jgi:hypothetical protein
LLRHLLKALRAPACDQTLARQGKISTNQLVRRAKAVLARRCTDQLRKNSVVDRDREIRAAADLIYNWLPREQLFGPALEMIVKEVQLKFRLMKEAGLHPSVVATPGNVSFADHCANRAAPI